MPGRTSLAPMLALLLAPVAALAESAGVPLAAAATSSRVALSYEKFTLENGLEVILHEDHRLPLVAVNVSYHVGPANERSGRTGFAHLFEHLMFEGSRHVGSRAHSRYLEAAGASDVNGTTDFDRTNYFETLPAAELELALWLESDRMGYLLEGLDAGKLANQRDVVRNERRQRYESAPYGLAREALWHLLFPPSHPYHGFVIGSHADIESAGLEDVREFSREYYTPNNASLAIAGDIDVATTRRLVEKYFASIPAGPAVAEPQPSTPPISAQRRAVVTDEIELPRLYMAWITAPAFHPGDAEADLAAQILGGGRAGRLYRRLVQQLAIAQDVSVHNLSLKLGSVFMLQATARAGVSIEELEQAVDAEIGRFRDTGPTAAELLRARNSIETAALTGIEEMRGVAEALNRYNALVHDPGYLPRDLARYEDASSSSVRDFAAAMLAPTARVVVEALPGRKLTDDPPRSPGEANPPGGTLPGRMPDEPWRALVPAPAASRAARLPTPRGFTLANGLKVILAEQHSLPLVTAAIVTLAGTADNPVNRPGLASFTEAMLEEGTRTRSAAAIADAAGDIGARLATRTGTDASLASLSVLRNNLAPALELLADLVAHPRLDRADVERQRSLRDGRLQQLRREPLAVSRRVLLTALYGSGEPSGYPEAGTREANALISVRELREFWAQHYGPRNSALILAGDLSLPEARAMAETYFGAWRSKASPPSPSARTVSFEHGARILLVDQPGAPQSTIRVGLRGVSRSTPDYVPLEILNDVFGGLASSRLNANLREAHGYTYGANSAFHFDRAAGYFSVLAQVRSDATVAGLKAILQERRRMHTTPPDSTELEIARGAVFRSLASRFETAASACEALAELYVYGLPFDYYASIPAAASAVTSIDVKNLADRYLSNAELKIVVVGDRARLELPLRELGVGWVVVVDEAGRPVH